MRAKSTHLVGKGEMWVADVVDSDGASVLVAGIGVEGEDVAVSEGEIAPGAGASDVVDSASVLEFVLGIGVDMTACVRWACSPALLPIELPACKSALSGAYLGLQSLHPVAACDEDAAMLAWVPSVRAIVASKLIEAASILSRGLE